MSEISRESQIISRLCPKQSSTEPARVLHYEFHREIGRGGMGVVFEGRDLRLERKVAIKVLKPEFAARENDRARFIAEARSMAAIKHPSVVTVHAVEDAPELPLIVMELLQGESLQSRLNRDRSSGIQESVSIGHAVARGLHAAHEYGLVHRDIKPANIWLESANNSSGTTVKILDFGLAETLESRAAQGLGGFAGTPAYVSPEQARSEPLDRRTDIYSLGIVMYRLLTGELPFSGTASSAMLASIVTRRIPPVTNKRDDLPESLCRLVDSMVASSPDNRPVTAESVVESLERIQSELNAGWTQKALAALCSRATVAYAITAILPAWIVWNGLLSTEQPRLLSSQSNAAALNRMASNNKDDKSLEPLTGIKVFDAATGRVRFQRMEVAGEANVQACLAEFDLSGLQDTQIIDVALRLPRSVLLSGKSECAVWAVSQSLQMRDAVKMSVDLKQLSAENRIVELASADALDGSFNGIYRTNEYIGLATKEFFRLVEKVQGGKLRLIFAAEHCDSKIDWSANTQLILEVLLQEASSSNE